MIIGRVGGRLEGDNPMRICYNENEKAACGGGLLNLAERRWFP